MKNSVQIALFPLILIVLLSCTKKSTHEIYIDFTFLMDDPYAPARVTFYNYTKGANTYQWDFKDGHTSNEKEPVHTFEQAGSYDVTLTAKIGSVHKELTKTLTVQAKSDEVIIGSPPSSLGLDPFYTKYVDAEGIPVISSEKVPDEALVKTRSIVIHMLKNMEDVKHKMISHNARVGIMSVDEVTTDIPEHAFLADDQNVDWDKRARGLGGTVTVPITTCAEENVLCYEADKYANEDILIHEFAHAIHLMGIQYLDTNFNSKLTTALETALANDKWKQTYAGTNIKEYWAEGVQSWFNCNAESNPADGVHNYVNTRSELETYDPLLFDLISQYFDQTNHEEISCHQ